MQAQNTKAWHKRHSTPEAFEDPQAAWGLAIRTIESLAHHGVRFAPYHIGFEDGSVLKATIVKNRAGYWEVSLRAYSCQ